MSQHRARVEFPVAETPAADAVRLMKTMLIPRPIAWVGTRSAAGVDNLAPHSFFTMVSNEPPMLLFASSGRKDTLANIEETGQFTVSIVDRALADAANRTSAPYGPEVDEFEAAGLQKEASAAVVPRRVAGSPAVFECELERVVEAGDGFTVFGRVVHLAVAEDVLVTDERGHRLPDAAKLDPVTRLGRNEWAGLGEVFSVERPEAG